MPSKCTGRYSAKKHQFGQIYLIELDNFKFNLGFIRITHEICWIQNAVMPVVVHLSGKFNMLSQAPPLPRHFPEPSCCVEVTPLSLRCKRRCCQCWSSVDWEHHLEVPASGSGGVHTHVGNALMALKKFFKNSHTINKEIIAILKRCLRYYL